jgi:Alw26I/Eco31I/Esp3I family type II restriction m6 adenine DNA methyltransferase
MSRVIPTEESLLSGVRDIIEGLVSPTGPRENIEFRLQVLEALASKFGGFSLKDYFKEFEIRPIASIPVLNAHATNLQVELSKLSLHPALVISFLARESIGAFARKNTGTFHTDFRLAIYTAKSLSRKLSFEGKVIDPACGAGILLTALAIEMTGGDSETANRWIGDSVYAADLSEHSLRASRMSLASLSKSLSGIGVAFRRWRLGDSLIEGLSYWNEVVPDGFDAVIANPPWGKIKVLKRDYEQDPDTHEIERGLFAAGVSQEIDVLEAKSYSKLVRNSFPSLGGGDLDLYAAFLGLFSGLAKPTGLITAILPASFIRAQGVTKLRLDLYKNSEEVEISIFDNKAKFFSIDSRFKFLVLQNRLGDSHRKGKKLSLNFPDVDERAIGIPNSVLVNLDDLLKIRPDGTLPEFRNNRERDLFYKVHANGRTWGDSSGVWQAQIVREIDMTKDRKLFMKSGPGPLLPIVEGRMISQYRVGAKSYVSGAARRAVWKINGFGSLRIRPQFYIRTNDLPEHIQHRVQLPRIGFCDITGQTNERTVMAALIPAGVVCGNKVPTITFPNDDSNEVALWWLAVANSFVFDWLIRRVITTSLNYFILKSVPVPNVDVKSGEVATVVELVKELIEVEKSVLDNSNNLLRRAYLRASIDARVAHAYGLDSADLKLLLQDFPLVDNRHLKKGLPVEAAPTASLIFDQFENPSDWPGFLARAKATNSNRHAYVPNEYLN